MTKCLVAYTSKHGQTEKIAHYIEEELRDHKWNVDLISLNRSNFTGDLSEYDILIFGSPVHGGRLHKNFNQFLKNHSKSIDEKKSHIFIVSLASATFNPEERIDSEKDIHRIIDQLPVKFDTRQLFAGALMYTKYSWIIRLIMKYISKEQGGATDTSKDHEYTNWNRILSYINFLTSKDKKITRHKL